MRHPIILVSCLVAVVACDKKKSAATTPEAASTTTTTAEKSKIEEGTIGAISIETDTLSNLQLARSVSPEVPKSVAGSGEGVQAAGTLQVQYLVGAAKSREACYIRDQIRQAKMQVDGIAQQLCFIESQKGMKAGGKYKMKFAAPADAALRLEDVPPPLPDPDATGAPGGGGASEVPLPSASPDASPSAPSGSPESGAPGAPQEETFAIFLDNTVKGKFTVFMCSDGKLVQKIQLKGASTAGSQGTYKAIISGQGFDASMMGAFDNGVGSEGRQRLLSQMTFKIDMGTVSSYMRANMELDLSATKVSVVKVASESSTSAGDFSAAHKELGTAFIGPNLGAALFQRTFDDSHPSIFGLVPQALTTGSNIETSRAFFDSSGKELAKDSSTSYADGGALNVKESDLPKLVPDSFKVAFEASDWDCSGTTDFTMDTSSAAFTACTDKFDAEFPTETCTDTAAYSVGEPAPEVKDVAEFREEAPPDIDDLPEPSPEPTP